MTQNPSDKPGSLVPVSAPTSLTVSTSWQEPPEWLARWRAHDLVPAPVSEIRPRLTAMQRALIPATPKERAAAIGLLVALHGTPDEWEIKGPFYMELLGEIPVDLLVAGVKAAGLDVKFFPKPAEIVNPIRDELARRRDAVRRLGLALMLSDSNRTSAGTNERSLPC